MYTVHNRKPASDDRRLELFGEDSSKSKVIEELLDGENLTSVLTNKEEKHISQKEILHLWIHDPSPVVVFMILVQW